MARETVTEEKGCLTCQVGKREVCDLWNTVDEALHALVGEMIHDGLSEGAHKKEYDRRVKILREVSSPLSLCDKFF